MHSQYVAAGLGFEPSVLVIELHTLFPSDRSRDVMGALNLNCMESFFYFSATLLALQKKHRK